MREGTILDQFNNLGGIHEGPAMPLTPPPYQPAVNAGTPPYTLVARMNDYNPDEDNDFNTLILDPSLESITDYSGFTGQLSPGIQAKARAFGVTHIIGRHKHESNFSGEVDSPFLYYLQPSEIIGYDQFLQSLNPDEQTEYANFLGIDFGKIGKAIGNAAKAVGKGVGSAAKAVGKGVGAAAKAVGKVAVGTAHVFRDVGVGAAHVVRDAGVGTAHVARDFGVISGHALREAGKFTWQNLPYIAAAVALFYGQPEIASAILGTMASMKAQGATDQQIADELAAQGYGSDIFGAGMGGGGYYPADEDGDLSGPDSLDTAPDENGNITMGDGSVYNVNTGEITHPDGNITIATPPKKRIDWLLWAGVAAVVLLIGVYLYKHGKLNFLKKLKF